MQIIPAIDIFQGKYVFLTQGKFTGLTVYSDSPADVAKSFIDTGFPFLHFGRCEERAGRQLEFD